MQSTNSPHRILLIQLRRLGDVVLTTALAADLRRAFPHATIDFLVGKAAAPLLLNNPDVSESIVFNPKQMRRMVSEVRRRRYDWLIDVQAHPRTAILSMFSGVPVRAGWDARFWGMAYTHRTPRHRAPVYMVRDRQRLIELLGVKPTATIPRLWLSDEEREQARTDMLQLNPDAARPVVGMALGTHEPTRDWRIDGFAEVAEAIEGRGARAVIFRFPGDDAQIAEFRGRTAAGTLVEWRGDRRFLALLARCSVLVSANTGPSHMALALGVPRVTIYGSTDPAQWSPGLPTTIALSNPRQECLGCRAGSCPVNYDCIRGIRATDVVSSVLSLLPAAREM